MPTTSRSLAAVALLAATSFIVAAPAGAGSSGVTYSGAFEFQGLANDESGKACHGAGVFGEMKRRARVTISEQDAAGDFSTAAKGRVGKGKAATAADGEEVCRMPFKAKAKTAPADDSTVYLEIKGVTFDIRFPVADVADGDMGTWTCEYSDTTCALVVGAD
jgi:hypothetical protein